MDDRRHDVIRREDAFSFRGDEPSAPRHAPLPRASLPTPATPLVGRSRERAAVCSLVRDPDVRAVTLTGVGGTGKTRLGLAVASELASEFSDGAVFVGLGSLRDPELVPKTIAAAIGVGTSDSPDVLHELRQALEGREILLLIDNFEQLLPAAHVLTELVQASPRLELIVTSRALLRIGGEHEFAVPPLDLPDARATSVRELTRCEAVALFVQRAQATRPDFRLTEPEAGTVAEICRELEGLPLALELAAARVRVLSLPALRERLEDRLSLLTGGGRDLPAHKRALRETIAWSHDLLEPDEQELFAQLSAFRGGFTLAAAEAVADTGDVLGQLTALVDNSLVRRRTGTDGEARFGMLETIAEFARERLAAGPHAQAVARRHAEHFCAMAETVEQRFLAGRAQVGWVQRFVEEHDNFRAALAFAERDGDAAILARTASALTRFWESRGHADEGRRWLLAALEADPGLAPALRARVLVSLAIVDTMRDPAESSRRAHEAAALFAQVGDKTGEARAFAGIALAAQVLERHPEEVVRLHERSLDLFRQAGDRRGVAIATNNLGYFLLSSGQAERATELLHQALEVYEDMGEIDATSTTLHNIALAAIAEQRHAAAEELLGRALRVAMEFGNRVSTAYCLEALAALAVVRRQPARAARLLGAGEALFNQTAVTRETLEGRLQQRVRGEVERALGPERLAREWAAGARLSYEDAVALGLARW